MRFRARLVGLAATALVLGIVVALPVTLLAVGATPIPASMPTLEQLRVALTNPDDGTLALTALKVIAWAIWVFLTASIVLEVASRIRQIRTPHLPGLRLPQIAAQQLVSAAALLFVAAPGLTVGTEIPAGSPTAVVHTIATIPTALAGHPNVATPPAATSHTGPSARASAPRATLPSPVGSTPSTAESRSYTVRKRDTLSSIAQRQLGSAARWPEIVKLNAMLQGHPNVIRTGTVLRLPAAHHTSSSTVEPSATNQHAAPTAASSTSHPYTVRAGDTLSGIAQRELGDARAYPSIFAASKDTVQPGGARMNNPNRIYAGWTLTIPGAATLPAAAGPAPQPKPQETLPATAARTATPPASAAPLAGIRAPHEISDASGDQPPPITLPPTMTPAPTTSAPPAPAGATQVPGHAHPEDTATEFLMAPWMVAGLTGGGAVLAGSALLLLRGRRSTQFRGRRPGRTLAAPEPVLAPVEKTILAVGSATAPTVEQMDAILRRLAAIASHDHWPMPEVAAVELTTSHVVLHLSRAADLPAPWTGSPDRRRWQVEPGVDLDLIGPYLIDQPAPYPLLLTVGLGDCDEVWLLNFEDLDVTIGGDPTFARDFARYIAAEIACNPWSAGVSLDCVGVAEEVAPMNPERIRTHRAGDNGASAIQQTLADAVGTVDRSSQAGLDVSTARATQVGADAWPARMLLIDAAIDQPALDELLWLVHSQAGRTGTAVVVNGSRPGAPGVVLKVGADGRITMPDTGLDLVAVGLTSDEAEGCAALLAQCDTVQDALIPVDRSAVNGWRAWTNEAGSLRQEHTLPRSQTDATTPSQGRLDTGAGHAFAVEQTPTSSSLLDDDDQVYVQVAATTKEDLQAVAPRVSTNVRHQVEVADPTLDADVAMWFSDDCPLPRLRLLGPVTARTRGKPIAKRRGYLTELLAYIALRPHGASPEQVADTFNATPAKTRDYVGILRGWLGTNPRTGDYHLPDARYAPAALSRGTSVYQVLDLLVDIDLFRRLRVRGEARGADGIDDLFTALRLVDGRPFDYSLLRRAGEGWAWLLETGRVDQNMLCAVVDVAHVATTHALHVGDMRRARLAAETAALAAPHAEIPRLDLAAVASAEGHDSEARRIIRDEVSNRTDDEGAPPDLPARTEQILKTRRDWLGTKAG